MSDPLLQQFLQLQPQALSQPQIQPQQGQPQQGQPQQGQPQQGQPQQGQPQQGQLQQGQLQQLHHLYPQALLTTPSQLQLLQQQLQSQPSQLSPLFQASQALQLQQRQQQHQQLQQQHQHQQPSIISQLSASELPHISHVGAGFQNPQDNQPTHSHHSYAPSVLNMDVESDAIPQGPTPRAESKRDEVNSWLIRECVEQVGKTFCGLKRDLFDDFVKLLQNYNNKRQDTLDDVIGDLIKFNRSLQRLSVEVAQVQTLQTQLQNNVSTIYFEVHALFGFAQKLLHDPAYASILEQLPQSNKESQNDTGSTEQ